MTIIISTIISTTRKLHQKDMLMTREIVHFFPSFFFFLFFSLPHRSSSYQSIFSTRNGTWWPLVHEKKKEALRTLNPRHSTISQNHWQRSPRNSLWTNTARSSLIHGCLPASLAVRGLLWRQVPSSFCCLFITSSSIRMVLWTPVCYFCYCCCYFFYSFYFCHFFYYFC